jgi:hypothetical protein
LLRLLLANGIDYTRLAAELKPLFLEQARMELLRAGQKETDSALSVLTGIHRKDVKSWREGRLALKSSREVSISCRVFARWVQDPLYRTRQKKPRALPRLGAEPSFETLARSVTQDVHPVTVLAELVRLGLVEVRLQRGQEMVVPQKDGFIPAQGSREMTQLFGDNLADHAAAAVGNLLGYQPQLEQSVFAEGITSDSARQLETLARKLWSRVRAEMIDEATRLYEKDRDQPDARRRVRLGIYFSDQELPSKKDTREAE